MFIVECKNISLGIFLLRALEEPRKKQIYNIIIRLWRHVNGSKQTLYNLKSDLEEFQKSFKILEEIPAAFHPQNQSERWSAILRKHGIKNMSGIRAV